MRASSIAVSVALAGVGTILGGRLAPAHAANIGVGAKKLIIIDKGASAKLVYVSKDAGITKGTGTDTSNISAAFDVRYDGTSGTFAVPAGAIDGGDTGWVTNKVKVAKFVNKAVPAVTGTKVAVIKPGKVLKIVGKTLGDTPIDIFGEGEPTGSVFTGYTVTNGAETNVHCTQFTSCTHKLIAGGTGAKLVCKLPNQPNPGCNALEGYGSPSKAFVVPSHSLID